MGFKKASSGPSYPMGGGGNINVEGMFCDEQKMRTDRIRRIYETIKLEKRMVMNLARGAKKELIRMAEVSDDEFTTEFVNTRNHLNSEVSRETGIVILNPTAVVETLMDANQWANMFTGIVSRAMTLGVFSTPVEGNYNGALQVMSTELQVPTPLISAREIFFLRYSKQRKGQWVVVDVSIDELLPLSTSSTRCRRRPSGFLIHQMSNGYSRVTWVEHVEVDNIYVHDLYQDFVASGLAFGAKRWVATLDRHCMRLASVMATNSHPEDFGVVTSQEGRTSILKLAERMVLRFCSGLSASTANKWKTISGNDNVLVMTKMGLDETGIVLTASTSFRLPVSHKTVFEILRNENLQNQWEPLSNVIFIGELQRIANGCGDGCCVSVLQGADLALPNMVLLHESRTDSTGSLIIFAPFDINAMNLIVHGFDPESVGIHPCGVVIFPDNQHQNGSLVTLAFQIWIDPVLITNASIGLDEMISRVMANAVARIQTVVTERNNA